jgi:single-strand DNA-binding protein
MYLKNIAIGNLGADPTMKYLDSGTPLTKFSMATNRTWKDKSGQRQKETVWLRVSVFGGQAEACNKYLKQGSKVLVEGRLVPDKETGGPRLWQSSDGTLKASYEINAQTVTFLDSRSDNPRDEAGNVGNYTPTNNALPPKDEIPF